MNEVESIFTFDESNDIDTIRAEATLTLPMSFSNKYTAVQVTLFCHVINCKGNVNSNTSKTSETSSINELINTPFTFHIHCE